MRTLQEVVRESTKLRLHLTKAPMEEVLGYFGTLPCLKIQVLTQSCFQYFLLWLDGGEEIFPLRLSFNCSAGLNKARTEDSDSPSTWGLYYGMEENWSSGIIDKDQTDIIHRLDYEADEYEVRVKEIRRNCKSWIMDTSEMDLYRRIHYLGTYEQLSCWIGDLRGEYNKGISGTLIASAPWLNMSRPEFKFTYETCGLTTHTNVLGCHINQRVNKLQNLQPTSGYYNAYQDVNLFRDIVTKHVDDRFPGGFPQVYPMRIADSNFVPAKMTEAQADLFKQIAISNFSKPVAIIIPHCERREGAHYDISKRKRIAADPNEARILFHKGRNYVYRKFADSHRDEVPMKEFLDTSFKYDVINCTDTPINFEQVKEQILFGGIT